VTTKQKIIRTNLTMPKDLHFWLKKLALAKGTSVSKEIRGMIAYARGIARWGEKEIKEAGL